MSTIGGDDVRTQAEAIIGADRPMTPAPSEPAPNAASGFLGLLLYPYRKWLVRLGLPVCAALIVYGIVTGSSGDHTAAEKACGNALPSTFHGGAALMKAQTTTARRLDALYRDVYGHDNAALAALPAVTPVSVCAVHAPQDVPRGDAEIAVLPDGTATWIQPPRHP